MKPPTIDRINRHAQVLEFGALRVLFSYGTAVAYRDTDECHAFVANNPHYTKTTNQDIEEFLGATTTYIVSRALFDTSLATDMRAELLAPPGATPCRTT